jgi:uncharacterized protein YjbJ (UPF0337 family)
MDFADTKPTSMDAAWSESFGRRFNRLEAVKEIAMNWDVIQGKWRELKGQVQQQWAKLTSDDLDEIDGRREELVGKLQKRYGYAKQDAEREIDKFQECCKDVQ